MPDINFIEVTESNGNNRLINVVHIALIEEYPKPDYNMVYLDINGADNAPVIIYVQDEYNSMVAAIKGANLAEEK